MKKQVLIIEDDEALRSALTQTLQLEGINVIQANGFDQARRTIRLNFNGVILSDIRMPQKSGFEVLEYVKSVDAELPVVFLTGEADVPMALRAMKEGAYDLLEKPCATNDLLEVLDRALGFRDLVRQKRSLELAVRENDAASLNFPGAVPAITAFRKRLRSVAKLSGHIHINGEKGVGKKLAAFTIFQLSPDRQTNISVNFQDADLTAFDAIEIPKGPVDFSVKFVDLATRKHQNKLLDLAKEHPDLRMIFSSEASLDTLLEAGFLNGFKALNISQIHVPNLKARSQDIPILLDNFMRQSARSLNVDVPNAPHTVYGEVLARDWPHNLPELRSFAQSMVLALTGRTRQTEDMSLTEQLDAFEKLILTETLKRNKGKAGASANDLGLPRKTFYDRLARFELRPKDFREK